MIKLSKMNKIKANIKINLQNEVSPLNSRQVISHSTSIFTFWLGRFEP